MFGKEKKPELVGAKEKLKRGQMLKAGMTLDEIKSKREGKQSDSPAPAVALIYIISCIVALFLTQGPWKNGAGFEIGHDGLDDLLLSSREPSIFGEPTIDYIIFIGLRGLMLFVAAGALPGLAFMWIHVLDKTNMNAFRTMWGVTVGIALVYFIIAEFLIPAIELMLK